MTPWEASTVVLSKYELGPLNILHEPQNLRSHCIRQLSVGINQLSMQ